MTKTVAVVQCRLGSSRLPRKALLNLDGKPVIQHVLERAGEAQLVDEVVLATTWLEEDDELAEVVQALGYRVYDGPEVDVLTRVYEAAVWADADRVVRLTGDCPRLEPKVIDQVIVELGRSDFSSNIINRTYPKGLDCEAMWIDTLARINRLATSEQARASVTWFVYKERPDLFVIESLEDVEDHSFINLCVDTQEDLDRLRTLVGDDAAV